jgi:hypothetical protein
MLRIFYYLVVLTIARRREPFANCSDTLVVLELIGENFTILPVIPVLLVVNKSPSWYVYPPSVICFAFRLWWLVEQFCILLRILNYLEITSNCVICRSINYFLICHFENTNCVRDFLFHFLVGMSMNNLKIFFRLFRERTF